MDVSALIFPYIKDGVIVLTALEIYEVKCDNVGKVCPRFPLGYEEKNNNNIVKMILALISGRINFKLLTLW